jgi:hypothetical protein
VAGRAATARRDLPALAVADSPESVLALLHAGPAKTLREATDVIKRTAAIQNVAIVSETPSAPLETLTVLVRRAAYSAGLFGRCRRCMARSQGSSGHWLCCRKQPWLRRRLLLPKWLSTSPRIRSSRTHYCGTLQATSQARGLQRAA